MIFDGDCHFCRRWVERWRQSTGDSIDYAPYQQVAGQFPEIPPDDFKLAVQLVEPGGVRSRGAEAVFRSLAHARRGRWMLWCYRRVPFTRPATEAAYRLIAAHRDLAGRVTQLLWGDHLERPEYRLAGHLFLRALGVIYLLAFVSLWMQISGLIGRTGILPLAPYLNAVSRVTGPERFGLLPTLSWIDPGDAFTQLMCSCGALVSLALVLGFFPAPSLLVLWALYLSLANDCRDFLGFQWDGLLLEAGFLAIFFAPLRMRLGFARDSGSRWFRLLLCCLLFRLMFSSGFVKLASGDQTWRSLTALDFHFETQPLPTWVAWYAHQFPGFLKRAMTAAMFFIELAAPFFIFMPRRLRLVGFALLAFLQVAILITGNYAFFNLLTLALCLLLLDDSVWPDRWRRRLVKPVKVNAERMAGAWPRWVIGPAGAVVLLLSTVSFAGTLELNVPWPRPVGWLYEAAEPFRTFNGYGLFAVMTTSRPEIIVEGSDDGESWLPYEFKWKPGDVHRRPVFVAPHQPRLDWQMWFAALGPYQSSPWFERFLVGLLEGSPEVLSLLERNPFPAHPPKYVRALVYRYRFTSFKERSLTGAWWHRDYLGLFSAPRSLSPLP